MRRRDFFRCALGTAGALVLPRGLLAASSAAVWGDYPGLAKPFQLSPATRAKKVLEIYIMGGVSPWESFYCVPDPAYGKVGGTLWWTFQQGKDSIPAWHAACSGSKQPLTEAWVKDSLGTTVHLGPHLAALRARKDLVDRMRVFVQKHTMESHELAVPMALTGHAPGAAGGFAVGAAVQRQALAAAGGGLSMPASYVLLPRSGGHFPGETAWATGRLPVASRPVAVRIDQGKQFLATLARDNVGAHAPVLDSLAALYAKQGASRLTPPGATGAVRSLAFGDHQYAAGALSQAPKLAALFKASQFDVPTLSVCGAPAAVLPVATQLKLAVRLLQHPTSGTRHVTVLDEGVPGSEAGWDSHLDHAKWASINSDALYTRVVALINKPGEKDPDKLDLDETMIVINTEFGRAPGTQAVTGRNHWPYGYTTALIGGPIGTKQAGLVGAIDAKGLAVGGITQTHERAAVLAAMGIWPFAPELFAVGGFPAGSEAAAAKWLKETVLGVS